MHFILAFGKVVNLSSSYTKQNICKLITDITIQNQAINTTKLPSFFLIQISYTQNPPEKVCIFIKQATLRTCKEREIYTTVLII